jgi:DNA-3-methyladenine glycosylase I
MQKIRCPWAEKSDIERAYHDAEWGVPVRDDRLQFEFLILEGFQAGLSWRTVLEKRENFRRAFAGFDPEAMAKFTQADTDRLLADPGIIRNRLKVAAAVTNAKAYLALKEERGSFADYMWSFVNGEPVINHRQRMEDVPATTPVAEALSKDLKKRGFKFVGPTVVYAHMQATGLVNDHLVGCFRHAELTGKQSVRP